MNTPEPPPPDVTAYISHRVSAHAITPPSHAKPQRITWGTHHKLTVDPTVITHQNPGGEAEAQIWIAGGRSAHTPVYGSRIFPRYLHWHNKQISRTRRGMESPTEDARPHQINICSWQVSRKLRHSPEQPTRRFLRRRYNVPPFELCWIKPFAFWKGTWRPP